MSLNIPVSESSELYREQPRTVSATLAANTPLMEESFASNYANDFTGSSLTLDVSPDNTFVNVALSIKNSIYTAVLPGEAEEIVVGKSVGYVGTYEGFLAKPLTSKITTPIDGSAVTSGIPAILDITFSGKEIFAVLTVGYATENTDPQIVFFGNLSDKLGAISSERVKKANAQRSADAEHETIHPDAANGVDGETRYQGSRTTYLSGYEAGTISLFHANELKNQGTMTAYVKVNTKSSGVQDYIRNVLGYGAGVITAYPDTFDFSICGNRDELHVQTNSYSPQSGSTTSRIIVPIYLGEYIGLQLIGIDITMSSTSVLLERWRPESSHPSNKVSWSIYKRFGWNPNTFDGNEADEGMTGEAGYIYEGSVQTNTLCTMTATGKIRYEYVVMMGGYSYTLHLPTGLAIRSTSLTIVP